MYKNGLLYPVQIIDAIGTAVTRGVEERSR